VLGTLLIGFSISMVLLLIASGLSLIFGMLGIVNFAHGALYMIGAFVAVTVVGKTGSFALALLVAPVVVALLGAAIEITLLRPLYGQPHEKQFLLTFGLLLVLEESARAIWGVDYRNLDLPSVLAGQVQAFGQVLPMYRLFVSGLGLCVGLALLLYIERARVGMVLRAAMANATMARGLGIKVSRYRTLVFALGGALAGLGGTIAAPLFPVQVNMGTTILIESFVVVIVGGLGNVGGAMVGAILLGLLQAFGQQYAAEWVDIATYLLLALLLLFRPQGLFNSTAGRKA
jgi:branched-chain amino acid transport system permease protein